MKVPAITTNPPPSSDTIRPKKSGLFTMASTTDRPTVKGAPQNPTTPVLPRMRAATSQRSTTNLNSASNLHPNISSRSPKSLARKTRAESVASPDPAYHHTLTPRGYAPARPSSAASNRSFVTATSNNARSSQSMFFHASEVGGPTYTPAPTTQPVYTAPASQPVYTAPAPYVAATVASSGPKFFHADGASLEDDSEPYRAPRAPRGLGASPQLMTNGPILTMPSARNANHSPPSSRPGSTVGYPASPRPSSVIGGPRTPALASTGMPEGRSRVKFVYANGAEELLPPRKPSSEIGSVTTSPQLPSSPRFGDAHVATPSPTKVAYPLSPLASPSGLHSPPQYFQRHAAYSSSRRSSLDLKVRHSRNASISSIIDMSVPMKEENGDADDEGQSGTGESGSSGEDLDEEEDEPEEEDPPPPPPAPAPPMTAAERIKAMEERAANSRRERKVMDLEISNASLLAINKTLEREMRKQTAQLRRYKRLARSGKLTAPTKSKSQSGGSASGTASESENANVTDGENWEVDDEEDEDTETEELSEEEEEEEEESDSKSEGTANDEKHREGDEKRLALDLSKHQALLESSAKMNKSLRGCLLVTDQLIKEGKKALEYKVRASDVRLGGRILRDEEDDYLDLESVDGDGLTSDFSAAGDTEAENTEAEETETEDEEGFQGPYLRPEELRPVRHTLV